MTSNKNPDEEPTKGLFEFDIEIKEPGAKDHEETLKNRNLAISITHPVLVSWLIKRQEKIKKEFKTTFPPLKDKEGNKTNFNPLFKHAKR